jgi:hypothetical protein
MEKLNLIDSYSRAEAIADGTLVDVTQMAKQSGIKYPVAITQAVDASIDGAVAKNRSDYQGILSDVLTCFRFSALKYQNDTLNFKVLIWDNEAQGNKLNEFKAVVGPGDTPAPVITISLPSED